MPRTSLLIWLHRRLQPVVERLHIRSLAQAVFRRLYRRLHPADSLVRTVKNGRELWVNSDIALHADAALKIDVEGGELAVLKGCRRVLREDGPAVYFAFHPWAFADVDEASREMRALFAEAGYTLENHDASRPLEFQEYSAVRLTGQPPAA